MEVHEIRYGCAPGARSLYEGLDAEFYVDRWLLWAEHAEHDVKYGKTDLKWAQSMFGIKTLRIVAKGAAAEGLT